MTEPPSRPENRLLTRTAQKRHPSHDRQGVKNRLPTRAAQKRHPSHDRQGVEISGSLVLFRRRATGVRRAELERFARMLRDEVAGGSSFECLITDDRELRRLNGQFLGKDYATDVLSFPAVAGPLGSLAISCERARTQAKKYGHTLEQELQILMLHGLLHLLGMDHEADRGKMARAEAGWRRRLNLPNSLIERARR